MIKKKYQIILADPPWHYNQRANNNTKFRGGAYGHYPLMSDQEVINLPISNLADPRGSILFLWATPPKMDVALKCIDEWGWKFKTFGFTWIKLNSKSLTPFFGVGFYSKSCCEHVLLATRGNIIKPVTDTISSAVMAPRGPHSQKPDEIQRRIELMYPKQNKIELFASRKRKGWDATGFDYDGIDIRQFFQD